MKKNRPLLWVTPFPAVEPEIELAWRQETRHRLAELENGQVVAVPGEEVSQRIRALVGR